MLTKEERLSKLDGHIMIVCDHIDEALDAACVRGYDENLKEVEEHITRLERLQSLRYFVESIFTPAERAAMEAAAKATIEELATKEFPTLEELAAKESTTKAPTEST